VRRRTRSSAEAPAPNQEEKMTRIAAALAAVSLFAGCASPMMQGSSPATVKVTPLGSHDGEFCPRDRALVFEDPNGTRILYDAGFTVRGADDPRLGRIDAVLLSHVHGDHLGAAHQPAANAGTCASPAFTVSDLPLSNTVRITVAKNAQLLVGSDMPAFLQPKVKAAGGDPSRVKLVRFGSMATLGGVGIATVLATHTNAVGPEFLDKELGELMKANGLSADVGPATGYILKFTNGLVVYLSGDTGFTSDQAMVVRDYYHAKLAVMNIGDVFTTGPREAAYVVNEMVKPNEVILSHANEVGTSGGKVVGPRTAEFIKLTKVPAHVPLSGRTMAFDAGGRCVAGC
jgi:L-ascorbate metabolism protein UlaG (beta-lactamase superfamily)